MPSAEPHSSHTLPHSTTAGTGGFKAGTWQWAGSIPRAPHGTRVRHWGTQGLPGQHPVPKAPHGARAGTGRRDRGRHGLGPRQGWRGSGKCPSPSHPTDPQLSTPYPPAPRAGTGKIQGGHGSSTAVPWPQSIPQLPTLWPQHLGMRGAQGGPRAVSHPQSSPRYPGQAQRSRFSSVQFKAVPRPQATPHPAPWHPR